MSDEFNDNVQLSFIDSRYGLYDHKDSSTSFNN